MRLHPSFLVVLSLVLLLVSPLPAADKLLLRAYWTTDPVTNQAKSPGQTGRIQEYMALAIEGMQAKPDDTKIPVQETVFEKSAAQPQFWKLTAKNPKTDQIEEVEHTTRANYNRQTGGLDKIYLIPTQTPKEDLEYQVAPRDPTLLAQRIVPRWELTNEKAFLDTPVDSSQMKLNLAYLDGNKALESSISFQQGESSTFDLDLIYGFNRWSETSGQYHFQAKLNANLSYKPKQNHKYLNKIDAQLDYLWLGSSGGTIIPQIDWLPQLGADLRVESDQTFDNTDGIIGIVGYFAINGVPLQNFAKTLCIGEFPRPAPAILLSLSYDWVDKISRDTETAAIREDQTTNRLRAKLYWSHTFIHNLDLSAISFGKLSYYDANLLFDLGGSYDFTTAEFIPDVNLTLEISPSIVLKSQPSFTLTYVNGKTRSKFENYDALLAGIKLPF